jgi:hypothetical protein
MEIVRLTIYSRCMKSELGGSQRTVSRLDLEQSQRIADSDSEQSGIWNHSQEGFSALSVPRVGMYIIDHPHGSGLAQWWQEAVTRLALERNEKGNLLFGR